MRINNMSGKKINFKDEKIKYINKQDIIFCYIILKNKTEIFIVNDEGDIINIITGLILDISFREIKENTFEEGWYFINIRDYKNMLIELLKEI
jgi:hypothetical protein